MSSLSELQKPVWYLEGSMAVGAICNTKVQVGKDQEKAQSEKDSRSKNRDGKKTN